MSGRVRMRRFLPLLAMLVSPIVLVAAAPPVIDEKAKAIDKALIDLAAKDSHILDNLTHLSDVIGPRLTGSESLNKAGAWAAAKMKSYGLTGVELEPWTIPEGWKRGPATAKLVDTTNARSIAVASYGWHPSTKGRVTADVVALQVETMKDLDNYKGKLKGAVVLVGKPSKMLPLDQLENPKSGGPTTFVRNPAAKKDFESMRAMREARGAFLTKEGAAAVFLDAGKPLGLLVTTGGWATKDRPSAVDRLPTLTVAHNHYELLWRLATKADAAKADGTKPDGTRPRIELEVSNTFVPGPVKVNNVVGEIKGTDKADEFVYVGAHLDSWDLGTGTMDNGTGTSVVLEVARVLAKSGIKPRRTIRFVLFAGEEQGLHGSRLHVERRKDEMKRVTAALVHDTGTGRVKGIGCGNYPKLTPYIQDEFSSLKALGVVDYTSRSLGGSDHASFAREGVPGFLMVQESAGYTIVHHTEADTLDRARIPDLIQGAQVMAVAAMRLANREELLPREPLTKQPRR